MSVPSWAEPYINCINGTTRYNNKVCYNDIASWQKNPSIDGYNITQELGGSTLYSGVTWADFEYVYSMGGHRCAVCTGDGIATIDIRTVSGGYAITTFNKPLRKIFYYVYNHPQYTSYCALSLDSGWYDPANGRGEDNYTLKQFTTIYSTLQSLFDFLLSTVRYVDIYVDGENWSRVSPVTYTWQSVPSISGKNGILSLATIKDDAINNGDPVNNAVIDAFSNLPTSALASNLLGGSDDRWFIIDGDTEEVPPRWFTRVLEIYLYSSQRVDFDFAGNIVNPDESLTPFSVLTSCSTSGNVYLSILVDDENEVAKVSFIHDNGNSTYSYNQETFTDTEMHNLWIWLQGTYESGEINEETGESDNFNPRYAEDIGQPTQPTIDALDTGFTTMFRIESNELRALATYMWSSSFLDVISKWLEDPSDVVVGIMMFPVLPTTGSNPQQIIVGGIQTPANGYLITDQYKDILIGKRVVPFAGDGGKGNFLDFGPFTKCSVVLPYCGEHSLDMNDVAGKELELHYVVDFLTGSCVAYILVNGSCHYAFAGQMGTQIPISKASFNNMISAVISAGATIGGVMSSIATGGLTAPLTAGVGGAMISNVMNMHPDVTYHSGGGGVTGWIGNQEPYIRIEEPIPKIGNDQKSFVGLPTYMTKRIGNCNGFTKVIDAHLKNIPCTSAEQDQINSLLKNGIIIHEGSSTPSSTPSTTGNIVISFMTMKSETNVMGKYWKDGTGEILTIEGSLLYNQSISNPKLIIKGDIRPYNYCYIAEFGRFYYISDITVNESDIQTITLTVDVLQSFKSYIENCDGLVERQRTKTNKYFNDSMMWTQNNKNIVPLHFLGGDYTPSLFDRTNNCYVITLAGGVTAN